MKVAAPIIDAQLAGRLVAAQFPDWAGLPIRPVRDMGWDNRTFRLGSELTIRLPSGPGYAAQVPKEQSWLPVLAPHLPLPIPQPVALGQPAEDYPWQWSIYTWLPGEPLARAPLSASARIAGALAAFLKALQAIDPAEGPGPGAHNCYRGAPLLTYDGQTREAISVLRERIDAAAASAVWEAALAAPFGGSPVWLHGDVSAGNLLIDGGDLVGVIDFGCLAVGDPAYDLAIAWMSMDRAGRNAFRAALPLDAGTWARGRGWALWKALVTCAAEPSHGRSFDALDRILSGG